MFFAFFVGGVFCFLFFFSFVLGGVFVKKKKAEEADECVQSGVDLELAPRRPERRRRQEDKEDVQPSSRRELFLTNAVCVGA